MMMMMMTSSNSLLFCTLLLSTLKAEKRKEHMLNNRHGFSVLKCNRMAGLFRFLKKKTTLNRQFTFLISWRCFPYILFRVKKGRALNAEFNFFLSYSFKTYISRGHKYIYFKTPNIPMEWSQRSKHVLVLFSPSSDLEWRYMKMRRLHVPHLKLFCLFVSGEGGF